MTNSDQSDQGDLSHPQRRRSVTLMIAIVVGLALLITACSNSESDTATADSSPSDETEGSDESEPSAEATDGSEADGGSADEGQSPTNDFDYSTVDYEAEPVESALRGNRANPAFPPAVIDPGLVTAALPPDVIPAIDSPNFASVDAIDFLADEEAVILVEVDGLAKAYPVQILIWHEIVNDTFGEVPVSVTYCPLCNSALAFDRRFGDRLLDFGTSGELYQSALVMYDRQTESLWAHFTGQGVIGHYAGAQLDFIPAQTISWAQFRDAHPDGLVLTRETGADRRYGENPYVGYDDEESGPFDQFFTGPVDPTLVPKARVVGIADEAGSVAVRFEDLVEQPAIAITDGGRNLVVFHQPGLASALDSGLIEGGRDVGQSGVYVAAADGTNLTFTTTGDPADGQFVDEQTNTTWNVLGQAVSGPLEGERLEPVAHLDTFWFSWATYRPETIVVDPS